MSRGDGGVECSRIGAALVGLLCAAGMASPKSLTVSPRSSLVDPGAARTRPPSGLRSEATVERDGGGLTQEMLEESQ